MIKLYSLTHVLINNNVIPATGACTCYIASAVFFQKINILIINQSIIDTFGSFFTMMTAVVYVDGTHMSRDSSYDQFICRIWHTRIPLWGFLVTSTYGILITALERYFAVIYPIWYNVSMTITPISRSNSELFIVAFSYKTKYKAYNHAASYKIHAHIMRKDRFDGKIFG